MRARHVGITSLGGVSVDGDVMLYPRMAALPMGWTHALWWCQTLHRRLVDDAPGLGDERYVCDGRVLPYSPKLAYTVYVDNFLAIGTCAASVRTATEQARSRLEAARLPTHDVCLDGQDEEVLGWRVRGVEGTIRPTARRVWRLRLALDWVLSQPIVAHDLERVLGHCTCVAVLRRECLS